MKKLILFLLFSGSTACFAAFSTNALNVTSSSITLNGTNYNWQAGVGTAGQCLTTDGGSPPTLTWGNCVEIIPAGAVNYALLEDATYILLEDNSRMRLEH